MAGRGHDSKNFTEKGGEGGKIIDGARALGVENKADESCATI